MIDRDGRACSAVGGKKLVYNGGTVILEKTFFWFRKKWFCFIQLVVAKQNIANFYRLPSFVYRFIYSIKIDIISPPKSRALSYLPLLRADGVFEFDSREHLQQDDAQAPHVHGGSAARVPVQLHPGLSEAVLQLSFWSAIPVRLDVLDVLDELSQARELEMQC